MDANYDTGNYKVSILTPSHNLFSHIYLSINNAPCYHPLTSRKLKKH